MLTAFIDESGRRRVDDLCVYALAAVIVDVSDMADCRLAMDGLRYGKSPVVHWRVERPARRSLIAKRLAGLPIQGAVAVAMYTQGTRSERARRQCLSRLLPELQQRGISEAELESRGTTLDHRDRQLLTGLRKSHQVSDRMIVRWGLPSVEPMLWAADCLAGSVTSWFGDETQYLHLLAEMVALIEAP
jgi:hypothetical protein